jgi:hypothetical protein
MDSKLGARELLSKIARAVEDSQRAQGELIEAIGLLHPGVVSQVRDSLADQGDGELRRGRQRDSGGAGRERVPVAERLLISEDDCSLLLASASSGAGGQGGPWLRAA